MKRVLLYRQNYLPLSETFIYQQLIGHERVKLMVLTRSKPYHLSSFPYKPIYVKRTLNGLTKWLKKKKINCLHARFGPAGLQLLPKARKTKIPLITSFHGVDISKRVKEAAYRRKLKKLFRYGDAFTVVSENMKNKLLRLGCPANKITIVRSGVDLSNFVLQPPMPVQGDAYRFLSVGRLVEKKGMDVLIRAFAQVHQVYPEATLTIVGEGQKRSQLIRLISNYKLQKAVQMTGALKQSGVKKQMEACHLFVNASKTAKDGNQEGIPNVLMEAMAIGRPVISTYHAGIPELVDHDVSGFLVKEGSVNQLAWMMLHAINQKHRWAEMVKAARHKVETNHDIRKQRRIVEDLYVKLIGKSQKK